jgi:hypothetical protein
MRVFPRTIKHAFNVTVQCSHDADPSKHHPLFGRSLGVLPAYEFPPQAMRSQPGDTIALRPRIRSSPTSEKIEALLIAGPLTTLEANDSA